MKIQEYIRILRQRGWIIGLAIVITVASALGFSAVQNRLYRSSIQVPIQLARPDLSLTQSTKQLLRSYATIMWTKQYAQRVIDELQLMRDPEDLVADVKIVPDESLMVLKIDVEGYDPEQTNDIANMWAQLLVQWRDEENAKQNKEDRVFALFMDPAVYRQIRPNMKINLAAGGIFGLTLGVAIVFVLEWLEAGIVRDPKTFEQETSLTIMGVIPPQ